MWRRSLFHRLGAATAKALGQLGAFALQTSLVRRECAKLKDQRGREAPTHAMPYEQTIKSLLTSSQYKDASMGDMWS